ncbi:MAG: HEAT repeat domain-containing protein [Pirellulales bacterium]
MPSAAIKWHVALTALLCAGMASAARGDDAYIFVLDNGSRLRGELVSAPANAALTYTLRTESGVQLTIDSRRVAQAIRVTPELERYQTLRHGLPDTVESHWKLAEWCADNGLDAQRRSHLERIVRLQPDHAEARRLLGYRDVDGQWLTRAEEMTARGMVLFEGSYRTAQEVEIIEQNRKIDAAQIDWFRKLRQWHDWIGDSRRDRANEAVQQIAAIRDPAAAKALAQLLDEESRRPVKLLLIRALAQTQSALAVNTLVDLSITDNDEEVRLTCLDQLKSLDRPTIQERYVRALKNNNNAVVNRAAVGLRRLGNQDAVIPLIDALVTTHRTKIASGNPGQMSTSFSPGGGGTFGFGGNKPRNVKQEISNREVLSALVELADGQTFGYDQRAWTYWYTTQTQAQAVDFRRD